MGNLLSPKDVEGLAKYPDMIDLKAESLKLGSNWNFIVPFESSLGIPQGIVKGLHFVARGSLALHARSVRVRRDSLGRSAL
jgi:hypothetical protein